MTRPLHDSGLFVAASQTITSHDETAPKFRQPARTFEVLMMNVRLWHKDHPEGVRHRLMADKVIINVSKWDHAGISNGRTACDVMLAGKYYSPIEAGYTGVLCDEGCFSEHEMRVARELQQKEAERQKFETERIETEREVSNEHALASRAEGKKRLEQYRTAEPAVKSESENDGTHDE